MQKKHILYMWVAWNEVIRAKYHFHIVLHIVCGKENKFESKGKWQLFCNANWLTYSTQTCPYDLVSVELATVFPVWQPFWNKVYRAFAWWCHLTTSTRMLWGKILYSVFFFCEESLILKNHSCLTQIYITKIATQCILVVVVKWRQSRHHANVLFMPAGGLLLKLFAPCLLLDHQNPLSMIWHYSCMLTFHGSTLISSGLGFGCTSFINSPKDSQRKPLIFLKP